MSFYAKYEILALLRDDAASTGVKTFSARHLTSGQTVGVHLLFENMPGHSAAVLERVRNLGPEQVSQVIEVGTHEGTPYVVTAQSIWSNSFDEWLGKPPAAAPPTKASVDNYGKAGNWRVPAAEFIRKSDPGPLPASAVTPIPEPGGFTRMFSMSPRSAAGQEMSTSSVLPTPAVQPVPVPPPALVENLDLSGETRKVAVTAVKPLVPPVAEGLGEFTRAFQVPAPVTAPITAPVTAPVNAAPASQVDLSVTRTMHLPVIPAIAPQPAPPLPVAKTPGEFTQMFQAMPAHTTPPPLTPVPAPGEFTQMFQTSAPTTPPSAITPIVNRGTTPPLPAPAPPAAAAPGEFTNIFKTGLAPAQQAPPPPAPGAGEFTRMFQSPTVQPTGEAPPAQQQPPPAPPPDNGPSEFTKFFQTPIESPAPRPHPALNDPFGKSAPVPPSAPQSGGPGEFTQMFGVPSRPSQGVAPEPYKPTYSPSFAPTASSSATGAFSTPSRPPSGPPTGGAPAGPGEYTQMFSAPSQPVAPASTPAPPEAAKPNYLPLIIVFALLFLIAAGLVAYFLMHR